MREEVWETQSRCRRVIWDLVDKHQNDVPLQFQDDTGTGSWKTAVRLLTDHSHRFSPVFHRLGLPLFARGNDPLEATSPLSIPVDQSPSLELELSLITSTLESPIFRVLLRTLC